MVAMHVNLDPELTAYVEHRLRVLDQVRQLLVTSVDLACPAEEIDPDTALFGTGLGLDSLDAAEIIIGIEVELGIKLEGKERYVVALRSVNALVDLVVREKEDGAT
jgi:acyl carrier protein